MKSTTDKARNLQVNGADSESPDDSDNSNVRPVKKTAASRQNRSPADEASDKPSANTNAWPFAPGTQGDQQAHAVKPVQKAGWNARQFRI